MNTNMNFIFNALDSISPSHTGIYHNPTAHSSTSTQIRALSRQKSRMSLSPTKTLIENGPSGTTTKNSGDSEEEFGEEIINPYILPRIVLQTSPETFLFSPPENLRSLMKGIYRSGFVKHEHFGYLRTLELGTIVSVMNDMDDDIEDFADEEGIEFYQIPLQQAPSGMMKDRVSEILDILGDESMHPVLVYSRHGKHRVGCITALLRRMTSNWTIQAIIDEYIIAAEGDFKMGDIDFIASFGSPRFGMSFMKDLNTRVSAFREEFEEEDFKGRAERESVPSNFKEKTEKLVASVRNWRSPTANDLCRWSH